MYTAHHSLRFHSIRIVSRLEAYSVFMAVSVYSICGGGGSTSFPNAVNVFLVSVLSFGGFFMHTCFTLSISTGARTMFHQHSYLKVFSMCALSCTSANGPKLVTQHKCKQCCEGLYIQYLQSGRRAGIAKTVRLLATGWKFLGSNPGGGEIFRTRLDRPCNCNCNLFHIPQIHDR